MTADRLLLMLLFAIMGIFMYSIVYGSASPEIAAMSEIMRPTTPLDTIDEELDIHPVARLMMNKYETTEKEIKFIVTKGFKYHTGKQDVTLCHCPMTNKAVLYNKKNHKVNAILYNASVEWIDRWMYTRDRYRVKK